MTADDPFDLQRFVDAQAPVYARVVAELKAGRKESHWMWFVFPQGPGPGRSAMSERYAIRSADEARASGERKKRTKQKTWATREVRLAHRTIAPSQTIPASLPLSEELGW